MGRFATLKTLKTKATPTDPLEIFRRLTKPPGINDLYASSAEVLEAWHERRTEADTGLKLHAESGKTLVGLLMTQSIVDETGEAERAEDLQREAHARNRNRQRPKVPPPYRPLAAPGRQASAIASAISTYRMRGGLLQRF